MGLQFIKLQGIHSFMKKITSQIFVCKHIRAIFYLLVSISLFWVITINRSPNFLRSFSTRLRTGYTTIVLVLFVVLYLVIRIRGWVGSLLSISLITAIFALALAGAWVAGTTESGLLSGVIPMFDSANYYQDALRLLAGQPFSDFSTRRPLFAAFFSLLLWVTRYNLFTALSLLTLFVALACYLLVIEIKRSHGPVVAIFAFLIIFIYYRYHSGVIRTENLGILFGVLGTALIWRSISARQPVYFIFGVFLTSLGMIARAGAFFILPLLVIWGAFLFKDQKAKVSWGLLFEGALVIVAAFLVNGLILKSFGAKEGIPFGNFSYSLYGLVSGGHSWADVLDLYPDADQREIYRLSFDLILRQPGLFVKGVFYNYSMFFSNTIYGLFSYMSGDGGFSSTISYWVLLSLSTLGIWNWFRNQDDPYLGFVMTSVIGLLLSVPFLPPTDAFRLRVYATSINVLALLPSMGVYLVLKNLRLERIQPKDTAQINNNALIIYSAFVSIIVVGGPLLIKGADSLSGLTLSACETNSTSVIVRYEPSAAVHFVSQTTRLLDWAPNFHIGSLRNHVHDFPNFHFMDWALANIDPGTTLFYALDYRTYQGALILVDSKLLPASSALFELCGIWEDTPEIKIFNIFYPSSLILLDQE